MALEMVFRDLQLRLQNVETAMTLLQSTMEDRPPDDDEPAVAEHVERIVLGMMGVLHEMRRTASLARRRVLKVAPRRVSGCLGRSIATPLWPCPECGSSCSHATAARRVRVPLARCGHSANA